MTNNKVTWTFIAHNRWFKLISATFFCFLPPGLGLLATCWFSTKHENNFSWKTFLPLSWKMFNNFFAFNRWFKDFLATFLFSTAGFKSFINLLFSTTDKQFFFQLIGFRISVTLFWFQSVGLRFSATFLLLTTEKQFSWKIFVFQLLGLIEYKSTSLLDYLSTSLLVY